jgi:four helix bundle protein
VEGYKRFHYLEKIKFYYNARASLAECSEHWIDLLKERGKVDDKVYKDFKQTGVKLSVKLSNFISSTYKSKSAL